MAEIGSQFVPSPFAFVIFIDKLLHTSPHSRDFQSIRPQVAITVTFIWSQVFYSIIMLDCFLCSQTIAAPSTVAFQWKHHGPWALPNTKYQCNTLFVLVYACMLGQIWPWPSADQICFQCNRFVMEACFANFWHNFQEFPSSRQLLALIDIFWQLNGNLWRLMDHMATYGQLWTLMATYSKFC